MLTQVFNTYTSRQVWRNTLEEVQAALIYDNSASWWAAKLTPTPSPPLEVHTYSTRIQSLDPADLV